MTVRGLQRACTVRPKCLPYHTSGSVERQLLDSSISRVCAKGGLRTVCFFPLVVGRWAAVGKFHRCGKERYRTRRTWMAVVRTKELGDKSAHNG